MCRRPWLAAGLLAMGGFASGCGADSPTAPSQPAPSGPAPTILSVTPSIGSTGGGSSIRIMGTGLQPGIRVSFGSATVAGRFDPRYTDRIFLTTPSHAAGLVDLVVTNLDGQTGVASSAYTFAPPESFDVEGQWRGGVANDAHDDFEFTVVNGSVVTVSCGTSGSVSLLPPAPISDGAFSFSGADGVALSGRILSPSEAEGIVTVGPCARANWYASKD